jgi:ABC-2 type transport system permease protein
VTVLPLAAHQTRYDLLAFARNPQARVFTVASPVILLVLLLSIFHGGTVNFGGHTVSLAAYYVPHLCVMAVVGAAFGNLLNTIVSKRETGALKRRRATPVPASALITGDVVTSILSTLVVAAVLIMIGTLFFHVSVTGPVLGAAALTLVVSAAAFCGMAYAISSFVGSVDAAAPMVQLVTLPLYFVSGVFVPDNVLPGWLHAIMNLLPVRPLAVAVQAAFIPATNDGDRFAWGALLVIVAWGAVGLFIAARRFSWAPHRR